MLKLKSISPSKIKTYDMCPFKYWLTYHRDDIELKNNWGAAHGSLLHNILEHYSNGSDLDWTSRLYRGYAGLLETQNKAGKIELMESPLRWAKSKDYQDKKPYCDTCPYANTKDGICSISHESLQKLSGCPKELFDGSVSMLEETIRRYENLWKKILRKDDVLIGTEYQFNIIVPGTEVPINGVVDLILEENSDTLHIIDYKTGVWTQGYDECKEDIQVRMYSLAARREFIDDVNKKGYKYKNVILTFDYFTKQPITIAFTKEEDEKTERYVHNKIKEIEATDWINRIVKSNDDFGEKFAWKCRSLCDTEVCASEWKGKFQAK